MGRSALLTFIWRVCDSDSQARRSFVILPAIAPLPQDFVIGYQTDPRYMRYEVSDDERVSPRLKRKAFRDDDSEQ